MATLQTIFKWLGLKSAHFSLPYCTSAAVGTVTQKVGLPVGISNRNGEANFLNWISL